MVTKEKRGFPRIADAGVSLKLKIGDFDMMTHTMNLSASGVYCKLERELPLMSRLKLRLMIPDESREGGSVKTIEADGVVVREHPVIIDGVVKHFDAAIFFEDLSEKDRETIKSYIAKKNSQRS
jgi:hypothetical protein